MLPPLLPCCSLNYPGWQLLNPFFSTFFSLSTRVSPVSRTASTTILRFLALFRLPPALPNPTLVPVIVVPVPISATLLASVPVPVPVPIRCSSTVPTPVPVPVPVPSPLPSSAPSFTSTPVPVPAPSLFPFPLRPRPYDRSRPRYRLRSHPRFQSRPRPRSLLPAPRIRLPPRYDALVQTPGLANGAAGCSQAPPPVCRDGDAYGMRVPAVKQKRIAAEDVLLLSLPPDVGTRWSISPTCAIPF